MSSVEGIEVVERQVEEMNRGEECQFETLPLKIIFYDLCINQQNEEIQSSYERTLERETYKNERKENDVSLHSV